MRVLQWHHNALSAYHLVVFLVMFIASVMVTSTAHGTITETYNASNAAFTLNFYGTGDSLASTDFPVAGTWTAEQISSVEAAISVWASRIGNKPGRMMNLGFVWSDMGSYYLGGSVPLHMYPSSGPTSAQMVEYVWRDGGTGTAEIPNRWWEGNDAFFYFNSTPTNWVFNNYQSNSGTYDFCGVVAHEFGHSLGFGSTCKMWWDGDTTFGEVSTWDTLLRDSSGRIAVMGSGDFTFTDGGVTFNGEHAMAANGGEPIKIYSPPIFSDSSLNHLDESTYPWALMTTYCSVGASQPTTLEWAMMQDLGWTVVPEPSTFCLLAATGIVFGVWRCRRYLSRRML
jgi:hypothetical protein